MPELGIFERLLPNFQAYGVIYCSRVSGTSLQPSSHLSYPTAAANQRGAGRERMWRPAQNMHSFIHTGADLGILPPATVFIQNNKLQFVSSLRQNP